MRPWEIPTTTAGKQHGAVGVQHMATLGKRPETLCRGPCAGKVALGVVPPLQRGSKQTQVVGHRPEAAMCELRDNVLRRVWLQQRVQAL